MLHSQNLFEDTEKKIIVYGCTFLANVTEANASEDLFSILKLNTSLKVFLTVENEKLAKTKVLTDFIKNVNVISIPKLTSYSMQGNIVTLLANEGINLSYENLALLVARVLPNALVIQNEIAKLKLFKPKELTKELIDGLTFEYNNDSIFKLMEYVLLQKTDATAKLYHALVPDRYSPIDILQILATQIIKLIMVYRALSQKINDTIITKSLGLSIFQLKNMRKLCMNTSAAKLEKFLNGIISTDIKIKKYSIEQYNSVRFFLLKGLSN